MIDPKSLHDRAMEKAEDWADKDHAAGLLEDTLAIVEGDLIVEYKARGESVTNLHKIIKSDTRWKKAASDWRNARREALVARLQYEQVNRFQDNVRTKESTERTLAR